MIMGESTKPPLDELIHFGVKGMKWGVRREPKKAFRGLSLMAVKEGTTKAARIQRVSDAQDKVNQAKTVTQYHKALGNLAAVERQNKAEIAAEKSAKKSKTFVNKAETPEQKKAREDLRRSRQQLVAIGAVVALNLIAKHGLTVLASSNPAGTSAIGSAAAKVPYIKPNRHGVHKITTMK